MIDTYTIVSNADVTLAVTTIDKGSEKPRDREVRLIVEVNDPVISSQSSADEKFSV